MTTTTRQQPGAFTRYLSLPMPVELVEDDGNGVTWLKRPEDKDWVKVTSMKNLWEMDGYREREQPVVRMHFRAATQDGRTIMLFQDLLEGQWYCEVTLGSAGREPSVPIYRA